MKMPELNVIQRILLLIASTVIMVVQWDRGFREEYLISVIISTSLLIIAFSGGIRIIIPPLLKIVTAFILIASIIVNVAQYLSYREALEFKEKSKHNEYDLILAEEQIKQLTRELEIEKNHNAFLKK